MKWCALALVLAFAVPGRAVAQDVNVPWDEAPSNPDCWFATFSIIAFDPATSELGVGVQSHAFTAGAAVPYAIPGIGAVATQAAANRLYGPKAIELLKQGLSPAEVVKTPDRRGSGPRYPAARGHRRQGRSAVYTGKHVIDRNSDVTDPVHLGGYAGHVTGKNFSVQGNTLASEDVREEHGARLRARQRHDGRAADGRARCRPGGRRRHPRHAVGRPAGRAAGAARLERRRRAHRRPPGGRCGRSVQGAAAAAEHQPRHAAEADRSMPRSSPRPASSTKRSPSRRRRWRFSRTATRCTTRWRSATRRRDGRCRRWCRCAKRFACTRTWRGRRPPIRSSRRCAATYPGTAHRRDGRPVLGREAAAVAKADQHRV